MKHGLANQGQAGNALRVKTLLGFCLLLAACGDDDPMGCRFIDPAAQPDDRVVEIGTLMPGPEPIEDRFVAWTDGSNQPLILGFQGGWMVQPTLRITALPTDPEGMCASLLLRNTSTAPVESGVEMARQLIRVGDHHYIGPIDDLLNADSEPLLTQDLTMEVTVISDLFMSGDVVTVMMTAP